MADRNISIRLSLQDGDTVRRALLQLGDEGQRALARIERGTQPASKGLLAVNAVARDLTGSMGAFGARLGAVGSGLMALGPGGLVAAAGIGALIIGLRGAIRAAREALDQLDALDDTANKLGVGVEALQEWRYAFEQNGVSAQTLEMALQRLGRRMGNIARGESQEVKRAFDELGISIVRADGGLKTIEEVLPEVADGLARMDDQNRRLAVSQKLFDSEGVAMVTLLQQGAEEMRRLRQEARELGAVIDSRLVAEASEVNDRLATMDRIVQTQLSGALVDLAPVVLAVAEGLAGMARWLGDVVDGFRSLETMSTRGLERRLAGLDRRIPQIRGRIDDVSARATGPGLQQAAAGHLAVLRRELAAATAERERIAGQLIERTLERNTAGPGGAAAPPGAALERIRELETEGQALVRLSLAHREGEEAVRAATAANKADDEVRRLKIAGDTQEAAAIRRLIAANEELRRLIDLRQKAAALTLKHDPSAAFAKEMADLTALLDTGQVSQETFARATEEAERRRLGASREAADGIRRALLDIRKASRDTAAQWEQDVGSMNQAARAAFVDIASGAKSLADGLQGLLTSVERLILGRVFDRTVGSFIDDALNAVFGSSGKTTAPTKHAGGIIGEAGPSRSVSPWVFAGAPRFHGGGLLPGEVPIIALRGERVLTRAQQDATARTIEGLAAMAGRAPAITVLPTVYVNAPNVTARTQASWSGRELKLDVIVEQIEESMARNMGRGEGIAPVMERRYGLNPAAGAFR